LATTVSSPPNASTRRGDGRLDLRLIRYVGGDGDRAVAQLGRERRDGRLVDVQQRHPRSLRGEQPRNRLAHAGASTRDHGTASSSRFKSPIVPSS